MDNKDNKKKKVKKERPSYILIFALIFALIPLFFLGKIIYDAIVDTGKPIFGDRFNNSFPNQITDTHIVNLNTAILALPNIENVEIDLISGCLRINVDTNDGLIAKEGEQLGKDVVATLYGILPQETYFTDVNGMSGYDYEINVFNVINSIEKPANFHYVFNKSSKMKEYTSANLIEMKNPDILEDLNSSIGEGQ